MIREIDGYSWRHKVKTYVPSCSFLTNQPLSLFLFFALVPYFLYWRLEIDLNPHPSTLNSDKKFEQWLRKRKNLNDDVTKNVGREYASNHCENTSEEKLSYGSINLNESLVDVEHSFCQQLGWESKLGNLPLSSLRAKNPEIVRSIRPLKSCRLAIILGGMPRSGSTLQTTLICKLLRYINVTYVSTYYNHHLHVLNPSEMAQAAKTLMNQENVLESVSNETVVVLKSHEFDPNLLSFCSKSIVVLSSRNLVDIAKSAIHASWGTPKGEIFASWIDNYECWRRYAALDIAYEDFASSKNGLERYMLLLYSFLSEALHRSVSDHEVKEIFRLAKEFSMQDANQGIPGVRFSNISIDLDEETLEKMMKDHSATVQLHQERQIHYKS